MDFIKLSTAELAFIIKYFALKRSYLKIKQDFHAFFEKKISGEQLMQVEASNKSIIEKQSKKEMSDIKSCKLSHSRVRLDILEAALEDASTPKAVRSIRVSETEWEQVYAIDVPSIAKLVQLAREEEFLYKRFLLELKKLDLMDQADEFINTGYEIQVDDGLKRIEFAP
jgi:hypothetical protein